MLKIDIDAATGVLFNIIVQVWNTGEVPTTWTEGLIIKIGKKGDLGQCSNWRGITLLNTINKVLSTIIHDRISSVLDKHLRKEQAGFRAGRSCIDHINTLRIIAEQSVEWQSPLYMLFVDFKQAFDSVDRCMMWTVLESYGISGQLLNIIQQLYRNTTFQVVHRGKFGPSFEV